jgi:hypothetical protein
VDRLLISFLRPFFRVGGCRGVFEEKICLQGHALPKVMPNFGGGRKGGTGVEWSQHMESVH